MRHIVSFWEQPFALLEHAIAASPLETVAFGLGGRLVNDDRVGVIVDRLELVPDGAYLHRSVGRFTLEPSYVLGVALRAEAEGRTLVMVHSHPHDDHPVDFSDVDDDLHRRLVPSFLGLLPGPVASLVRSRGGWNGRLWIDAREERQLDAIKVVGRHLGIVFPPAGESTRMELGDFDRQVRAFGAPAQRKLQWIRLGIVGLGGTGSIASESCAHLGVEDFVLIDAQRLEQSNLSRVVGARPGDVRMVPAMSKVSSAARLVTNVRPTARVAAIRASVTSCDALTQLRTCDVILLCTDGHASRAAVNRVAYQYGIPVLDVGTLFRGGSGAVRDAFAEVRLAAPGSACLRCQGVIDPELVADEERPDAERTLRERFGYSPGARVPAPSVLPLNSLAVALAGLRLLDLLEPWLEWDDRVLIEAKTLLLRVGRDRPVASCDVCGEDSTQARGDDIPLPCRDLAEGEEAAD